MHENRFFLRIPMETEPSIRRGRPKTPLLDRLRVVVWAHHVMHASGERAAEAFELRYANARGKIHLSRGLWSRYLRGETLPQSAVARSDRSLVKRLDAEYPGTGEIFVHPVWRLLDFQELLGPDQLLLEYIHLGEAIWLQFVNFIEQPGISKPPLPGAFWSMHLKSVERKQRLSQLSGLDGLAACLIEGRMGFLSQAEERFVTSMLSARKYFNQLTNTEPFSYRRAQTVLLVMEAYCIAYLERVCIAASNNGDSYTLLKSKQLGWRHDWGERCQAHTAKLSSSSFQTFKSWLMTAAATDPNRPCRPGRGILVWMK